MNGRKNCRAAGGYPRVGTARSGRPLLTARHGPLSALFTCLIAAPGLAGSASEISAIGAAALAAPPSVTIAPKAAPSEADAVARIFEFALSELSEGHFALAQRQFELFVAAAPDHPLAPRARQHLSELYQARWAAGSAGSPGSTPAAVANTDPGAAAAAIATSSLPPPRRLALPRKATTLVEESFISEAGDRVFFGPGSAELGQRARIVLQAQARWLKRNAGLFAVIEGHADDDGLDRAALERLSQARADAVYLRLIEEGVPKQRLATSAWGHDLPIASCDSTECAAQNRRAITVLTPQRVSELPTIDTHQGVRRER